MVDPRDELWNATFDTYYSAYFQELVSDVLLIRWQRVDDVTKVVVALFASGSAIAGAINYFAHSLDISWMWPVLSGVTAVVALFHKELSVSFRLRDHGDSKRAFSVLRLDLETFRYRMKINPEFPVGEFCAVFEGYRKQFSDELRRLKVDAFVTRRMREICQEELDAKLAPILLHS